MSLIELKSPASVRFLIFSTILYFFLTSSGTYTSRRLFKIINSSLEEAARKETIDTLHGIITSAGGTIEKVDEWGMREFAYRIEDMTKGYYVVLTVCANNDAISEFDRICRINAGVVRHMIVKRD